MATQQTTNKIHIDLFAGIGGFSLAVDRVFRATHIFVEIESHLQKVISQHWPDAQIISDVKQFVPPAEPFLITGGFPCQDISRANTNKNKGGIYGRRSGLWAEYFRILKQSRPKYCIIENVYDLLSGGFGRIIQDLASIRYDATWTVIDSQYTGVPQRRRRVYILGVRDGIPRGADPLNNKGRSGSGLRKQVDTIKKVRPWYFKESEGGTSPIAFFTRQRSNEYALCGLSSTIAKRDYKSHTDLVLHGNGIVRRVSPRERMRLQGMPTDWLERCNLSEKQKYQANGMTIPAVTWVIKKLFDYDKTLDI